jgi:hypothetical protein
MRRRHVIAIAYIGLIALTAFVLWRFPERLDLGMWGAIVDEREDATYYAYMYFLRPPLIVALLWVVYFLIQRVWSVQPSRAHSNLPNS